MAKVTRFTTPTGTTIIKKGPRKVKTTESSIIRTKRPEGGFDLSAVQKTTKVKTRRSGKVIRKEKSRIEENYNNPKTAKTQISRSKFISKNGKQIRSKIK